MQSLQHLAVYIVKMVVSFVCSSVASAFIFTLIRTAYDQPDQLGTMLIAFTVLFFPLVFKLYLYLFVPFILLLEILFFLTDSKHWRSYLAYFVAATISTFSTLVIVKLWPEHAGMLPLALKLDLENAVFLLANIVPLALLFRYAAFVRMQIGQKHPQNLLKLFLR